MRSDVVVTVDDGVVVVGAVATVVVVDVLASQG